MVTRSKSLISLQARLSDAFRYISLHAEPALLLALLFAFCNLAIIKLFQGFWPDIGDYLSARGTAGGRVAVRDHLFSALLLQTLMLMILIGHCLLWARICLLGRASALLGGIDAFLRRFSVCLTRLVVGGFMAVALSVPAVLVGAILTNLLHGVAGGWGDSVGVSASLMLVLVPSGIVLSALILSICAEAIDRRLSISAAMRQTQPAWTRLAVVMMVVFGTAAIAILAVFEPLAGAELFLPASPAGLLVFIAWQMTLFLAFAVAIGALAPLLRDKKKKPDPQS